jgi:hypothetical protein
LKRLAERAFGSGSAHQTLRSEARRTGCPRSGELQFLR